MKYRYVRILIALTLMFTWLGFRSSPAFAAGCRGATCNGLNPATMGCPAVRSGSLKFLPDGYSTVETRKSGTGVGECDAKWARTYNLSGGDRWAAADLKCGGGSYPSCQVVSSQAKIASSSTVGVFTPMTPFAATLTRSCGCVRTDPGPISTPIVLSNNWCTGVN